MRFLAIIVLLFGIAACSTPHNPTVYPYIDQRPTAQHSELRHLMIASNNLGAPSRHYLTRREQAIDAQIQDYLKQHGFIIHGNKSFEQQWKNAELQYGALFNPLTGQQNPAYTEALKYTLSTVFANNPTLDAIVFTDLIETQVQYQQASKRFAQWHGVHRRIKVEGIGNGVPDNFDWSQTVDAVSLSVSVFNREQQRIFHSIGGIQIVQALVLGNSTAEFRRRNDLLVNDKEIQEGIELALHPLIVMKKYPD